MRFLNRRYRFLKPLLLVFQTVASGSKIFRACPSPSIPFTKFFARLPFYLTHTLRRNFSRLQRACPCTTPTPFSKKFSRLPFHLTHALCKNFSRLRRAYPPLHPSQKIFVSVALLPPPPPHTLLNNFSRLRASLHSSHTGAKNF